MADQGIERADKTVESGLKLGLIQSQIDETVFSNGMKKIMRGET